MLMSFYKTYVFYKVSRFKDSYIILYIYILVLKQEVVDDIENIHQMFCLIPQQEGTGLKW